MQHKKVQQDLKLPSVKNLFTNKTTVVKICREYLFYYFFCLCTKQPHFTMVGTTVLETDNSGKLTGKKYVAVDCGGFPDCLFKSLLYLLKSELAQLQVTDVKGLRNLIATSLTETGPPLGWRDDFLQVIKFQRVPPVTEFSDFLDLLKTNLCGGTLEVKALCNKLQNIKIRIITENSQGFIDFGSQNAKRIVRLYYIASKLHYQALTLDVPKLEIGIRSLPPKLSWKRPEVCEIINDLCRQQKRVYISNYGGTGKTTVSLMIANALISGETYPHLQPLLQENYSGGVIWFNFGKEVTPTSKELQHRLKNLILSLDYTALYSKSSINSLKSLTEMYKLIATLTEERKILFIFDDIWNASNFNIVNYISQTCGIIVTSRILPNADLKKTFNVFTLNDKNEDFLNDIISQRINLPENDEQWLQENQGKLTRLYQLCLHTPLLISLCGEAIKDNRSQLDNLIENLSIPPITAHTPENIEEQVYAPIISLCFSIKGNHSNKNSVTQCNELNALQTLAIFPRNEFPLPFTIYNYWIFLFHISYDEAFNLFNQLLQSNLIQVNEFSQNIQIHDVIYDTIEKNTSEEQIKIWKENLSKMYLQKAIEKQKRKKQKQGKTFEQQIDNKWTEELISEGPQDNYFFLNYDEIVNNDEIVFYDSKPVLFARNAKTENIPPNILWKLFKYSSPDHLNEDKFLSLQFHSFSSRDYRPLVFFEESHPWSTPHIEKLGLIHFVCIYGTAKMLEFVVNKNIYLGCVCESSNTQRMPMEIVLSRKDCTMARILLRKRHTGMIPVASCSLPYAASQKWRQEGNSGWGCVTSLQIALHENLQEFALELIKFGCSTDNMSGEISFLEYANTMNCFSFLCDFLIYSEQNAKLYSFWRLMSEDSLNKFIRDGVTDNVKDICKSTLRHKKLMKKKRQKAIENGEAFRLPIKTLGGEEFLVDVISENLVFDLKTFILDLKGMPISNQRLIYKGKQLENERLLKEYNIVDGSLPVNIVLSLRGGT